MNENTKMISQICGVYLHLFIQLSPEPLERNKANDDNIEKRTETHTHKIIIKFFDYPSYKIAHRNKLCRRSQEWNSVTASHSKILVTTHFEI